MWPESSRVSSAIALVRDLVSQGEARVGHSVATTAVAAWLGGPAAGLSTLAYQMVGSTGAHYMRVREMELRLQYEKEMALWHLLRHAISCLTVMLCVLAVRGHLASLIAFVSRIFVGACQRAAAPLLPNRGRGAAGEKVPADEELPQETGGGQRGSLTRRRRLWGFAPF
jgi:hypothetical protein